MIAWQLTQEMGRQGISKATLAELMHTSSANPKIRRMAKAQGADIYFGDAAHIRSDHHAGRTWGGTVNLSSGCDSRARWIE